MKRKSTATVDSSMTGASSSTAKKAKTTPRKAPAYTAGQTQAINELRGIINQDKSTAAKLLKQHNWNVNSAIDSYFNNQKHSAGSAAIRAKLNSIFDQYRDDPKEEPDEINAEGTGQLLEKLQIDLEDVGALIFSEIVQSPSLGKLTREGFVDGWNQLGVDSLNGMKSTVAHRRDQLANDKELFKQVYNHTFTLALAPGAKTLPIDMAVVFWRTLLTAPGWQWQTTSTPWLDWWLEFQEEKRTKAVNKDLWKQTFTFAQETVKDDSLSFWSDESSWPSVIDEFVGWIKQDKRGGADAMAVD